MHLRNPSLGPNSGKQIWDSRIMGTNSWVNFLDPAFSQQKRPPENPPSRNSPLKIHLPSSTQKYLEKLFTLHLCRAILLNICSMYSCKFGFLQAILAKKYTVSKTCKSSQKSSAQTHAIPLLTIPLPPCAQQSCHDPSDYSLSLAALGLLVIAIVWSLL